MQQNTIKRISISRPSRLFFLFFFIFLEKDTRAQRALRPPTPSNVLLLHRYAQSFPYERAELDRVLTTFRDPWGPACVAVTEGGGEGEGARAFV